MKQQNLFDSSLVFENPEMFDVNIIDDILAQHPEITALFVLADFAAIPILKHLNEKNIKISIFGFDNLRETANLIPALSTVEQQFYQIGFNAAQLLYERIINPNKPFVTQAIPVKLIIRDSVYQITKNHYYEQVSEK